MYPQHTKCSPQGKQESIFETFLDLEVVIHSFRTVFWRRRLKRSSTSLMKKVHPRPRQNLGMPMISIVHCWKTSQKFIHEQHEHDVTKLQTESTNEHCVWHLFGRRYCYRRPYGHLRCQAFFRMLAWLMISECRNAPRSTIAIGRL